MEAKICNKCNNNKLLSEFRNRKDSKDGKRNNCKICQSEQNKIYNILNQNDISIKRKEFYNNNQKRLSNDKKIYYETNKEVIIKKQTIYDKLKKETDPIYRLKKNMRIMVGKSLTKKSYTKKSQTFTIIGCLQNEFIKHIESKFENWMNWDNYGLYNGQPNYGWDIDHIIPLICGISENDILKLNHYTNFQPLCSYYNRNVKRDNC